MRKFKKSAFWCAILLYTVGYLYFFLVSLEGCAHAISFYKSALGKLSPYFYSDWMFEPAIVCGIIFLTGCIMLTKLIYGRFRRGVAILPSGGIALQILLVLFTAIFSANTETKYAYAILPLILCVYLVLLWIFCLKEYRSICKSAETD